jgi:NADPH:quinone reductase-like Zn-dependent oxidoreductase
MPLPSKRKSVASLCWIIFPIIPATFYAMTLSSPPAPRKIPETMKVAVATGFGEINDNIFVRNDWPTPELPSDDNNGDHLIIRVLACALAPGDVRVLSGKTDYIQLPKSGHPYVIGSDVSGIVVAAPKNSRFKAGDYVVSRFDEPKPNGGVADFRLVEAKLTEKCPDSISPLQACGLPASAMAAKKIVRDCMKKGDRVLVIGGSGGVGSCVLQYTKRYGASFVAAVSTQTEQCLQLGADRVIDYREQKWWKIPEFEETKFDVVFDLVNGENWVTGAYAGTAISRKGTYVALMTGVDTELEAHGIFDMIKVMCVFIGRMLWSRLHPGLPKWVAPEALALEEGDLKALFKDVAEGFLVPILDPASPFDFTEEGVRKAMQLQKSRHSHGKVVIEINKA